MSKWDLISSFVFARHRGDPSVSTTRVASEDRPQSCMVIDVYRLSKGDRDWVQDTRSQQ